MWPVFETLAILFEAVTLTILVYNDNCGFAPLLQLDWHFRRRLYLYGRSPILVACEFSKGNYLPVVGSKLSSSVLNRHFQLASAGPASSRTV